MLCQMQKGNETPDVNHNYLWEKPRAQAKTCSTNCNMNTNLDDTTNLGKFQSLIQRKYLAFCAVLLRSFKSSKSIFLIIF